MKYVLTAAVLSGILGAAPPSAADNAKAAAARQRQNLEKLRSDCEAIRAGSRVTTAQTQAVRNDLKTIYDAGAQKPSRESVIQLADDLTAALADGTISTAEVVKLSRDVGAVLNSANVTDQEAKKLLTDVRAFLQATDLSKQDVQTIYQDVEAILATARKNAKTKSTATPS